MCPNLRSLRNTNDNCFTSSGMARPAILFCPRQDGQTTSDPAPPLLSRNYNLDFGVSSLEPHSSCFVAAWSFPALVLWILNTHQNKCAFESQYKVSHGIWKPYTFDGLGLGQKGLFGKGATRSLLQYPPKRNPSLSQLRVELGLFFAANSIHPTSSQAVLLLNKDSWWRRRLVVDHHPNWRDRQIVHRHPAKNESLIGEETAAVNHKPHKPHWTSPFP